MPNQAIKFEFSLADLVEGNADNEVKKMSLQALMLMENIAGQVHTFKSGITVKFHSTNCLAF